MAEDRLYRRFPGRSDWQRNNDGRFRTLWRHCRALRYHAYHTLLLACLCFIALHSGWNPGILTAHYKTPREAPTPTFPLDWFPLAENPWGRYFNPQRQAPTTGFIAYYFNLKQPNRVIASENVPIVNSRGVPEAHNIIPEAFGAYWVGRLHITQTRHYSPPQNSDGVNMRILLNGHVIHQTRRSDGSLKKPLPVYLQPGDYLLEIELGGLPPRTDFFPHE
jgi:hypothetical protein